MALLRFATATCARRLMLVAGETKLSAGAARAARRQGGR